MDVTTLHPHSSWSLCILQVAAGPTPVACGRMEPPAVFRTLTLPRPTLSCYKLPQKNCWKGLPLSKQQLSQCETYVWPPHQSPTLSEGVVILSSETLLEDVSVTSLCPPSQHDKFGPWMCSGMISCSFYGRVRRLQPLLSVSSAVRGDSSQCEYGDACSLSLIITSAQLLCTITSGNWPVIVAAFPRWWWWLTHMSDWKSWRRKPPACSQLERWCVFYPRHRSIHSLRALWHHCSCSC